MSEVIDPAKLKLLTAPELQRLVGGESAGSGADSEWEYDKIMASVVCRHGYSTESAQVIVYCVCYQRGACNQTLLCQFAAEFDYDGHFEPIDGTRKQFLVTSWLRRNL